MESPVEKFYQRLPLISKGKIQDQLKNACLKSLNSKKFSDALMWLEEYRLYAGDDEWSREIGHSVAPEIAKIFRGKWSSIIPPDSAPDQHMRLTDFKDCFTGQRAFLAGNGPSLNALDLNLLRDEIWFGVNYIFLKTDELGFQPSFYLMEDYILAEDRAACIGLQSDSVKIFPYFLQDQQTIGMDYESIYTNLLMSCSFYTNFPHFSVNASEYIWFGWTVTYFALQLIYYMGFSEIYLIGFDHTFVIPDDAIRYGKNNHNILSQSDDRNHFHPNYFGPNFRWNTPKPDKIEASYKKAKHAYEIAGRKIFNATKGGNLEIFNRISYETIFEHGQPAHRDGILATDWLRAYREKARETLYQKRAQGRQGTPDLSVIVPVYNVENYIHKCLSSIVTQTLKNFEIIVVDDGSTDLSMEIVKRFCREDPRIVIISQENQGLGAARNTGIQAANAPYILFIDSDDYIDREICFELVHKAKKEQLDIVNCYFDQDNHGKRFPCSRNMGNYSDTIFAVKDLLQQKSSGAAWGRIYKKQLFTDHNIEFPRIVHEDLPVIYRLYLFAQSTGTVEKILYHYVQQNKSLTSDFNKRNVRGYFKALDFRYTYLHTNRELWSQYKHDYYAGMWSIIRFQLLQLNAIRNSDQKTFDSLFFFFLAHYNKRSLYSKKSLSYLKNSPLHLEISMLFGKFISEAPLTPLRVIVTHSSCYICYKKVLNYIYKNIAVKIYKKMVKPIYKMIIREVK